jgi:hypothetical protein
MMIESILNVVAIKPQFSTLCAFSVISLEGEQMQS